MDASAPGTALLSGADALEGRDGVSELTGLSQGPSIAQITTDKPSACGGGWTRNAPLRGDHANLCFEAVDGIL